MGKEKIDYDVVGHDVGGSKVFKDVGAAAKGAGDQVDDLGKKSDKASEQVDGLGKSSKTTGDKVKQTTVEFRGLNAEIAATQAEMRRLATEIDKTGNKDLFKDLRRQRGELRRLVNARQEMGEAGLDGAAGFVDSLAGKLRPMLGNLPMGQWLAPAAVAAAPIIAATIGAAVTAGVALGVTGIGVKLATQNAAVKSAGQQLGAEFSRGLVDASQPFVPATIKSIDIIRDEFQDLRPELREVFADAAEYVEPLTKAATGFARGLVPGLRDATAAAGPLVDVLGEHGPKSADAFSDALTRLSNNSEQNARALDLLLTATEFGVTSAATNIDLLSQSLTIPGDALLKLATGGQDGARKLLTLPPAADKVAASVGSIGSASVRSKEEFDAFTASIEASSGRAIAADAAVSAMEESIDRATEAARRNGDGIDQNVPKQRANHDALRELAVDTNAAAQAILDQTGRQDLAAAAAERGRQKFLEVAHSMGVGKTEANRLADALFALPVSKTINVEMDAKQAKAEAAALKQRIAEIKTRIDIKAVMTTSYGGGAHTGQGYSTGYSEGGRVFGEGTDTSDSVVQRVSRDEYVIRARAARAIGYGTLDELNQADRRPGPPMVSSAGGSMPAGRGGSGVSAEDFYRAMVRALQTVPVSRDPALAANIYARGG